MDDRAKPKAEAGVAADLAAALDWWREAGVDADFSDAPTLWLAKEEPPVPGPREGGGLRRASEAQPGARGSAPERSSASGQGPRLREDAGFPAPPAPAIDRSAWPQDLASFAQWWLSEPALDDGRTSGRVPPRGASGAEIMIVAPEPEREDAERLLSGPQGRLLDAMLAAMGFLPDQAYVASVLPRHTPMADWDAVAAKGLGALLAHHVKLVGPARLVALGANILPLLGHDPAHNPAVLRHFNHEGLTIPLLAGKSLAALLERPRWKAGLWQGWLDWTGGQASQG
jgi:DNA polymerase